MKSWRIIAVLVLCLVLTGSLACNLLEGGDKEEVSWQEVEVVRGDLMVSVSGSGNIGISHEVELAFSSGGKIDRIYVKEGDKVSEGDTLAQLDTYALELALIQALVARDEAKYNLGQQKVFYRPTRVAELRLEAAEQAVAQAQKELDEATITAPFDGVVASVNAEEGDIIPSPTMSPTTIVHLIDLTSMELKAEVNELDIPSVELGQKAIISVDALPTVQLEGEVTFISLLAREEAGLVLYDVTIDLDLPEGSKVKSGMSATADIIIDKRSNVLLVPNKAIKQDSQGYSVIAVKVNEHIQERRVVTGISDGYQTEIVRGLYEGDVVVIEKRVKKEPGGLFF